MEGAHSVTKCSLREISGGGMHVLVRPIRWSSGPSILLRVTSTMT